MDKSRRSTSKLVEILLVVFGTILLLDAVYNQPSSLFMVLGLTHQFIILFISIAILIVAAVQLKINRKEGDKRIFIIGFFATAGLHIVGKDSVSTIIGIMFLFSSIIFYQLAKNKEGTVTDKQ